MDKETNLLKEKIKELEKENSLLQTHMNYETFFNTNNDFLFVLDEQANIIHTNSTVINQLGYTREELAGNSVLMVHPADRREEAGRIVGEILKGTAEFCPVPLSTKSGKQIPVETRVQQGNWNGKPAIFGVTKDVSQIKLSEEKFSKVFYRNPLACGFSDIETGKYVEVNEAFYSLLGFDKNEVIGKKASELGILTQEAKTSILSKISNSEVLTNVEADLRAKNGDIKHVLLSAENIFIQDKKLRYTVVQDITERKQAELALFESKEQARQNNELLRSIMESPKGMIIFSLDPQYRYTAFTVSYKETMKYIWGVDIKVGMNMLDIIHNDGDREKAKHNFDLTLRGEHLILFEEYGADDLYRTWWENRYSPIYSDTNTIVGLTVFVTDITERKQSEAIKSIQYEIIRIVFSTKNLSEFYEMVRGALGRIMKVENFYVAFYDEKTDQLSAVFEKDKKDQIPKWPSGKSLTGRVIKEQKPLILKKAEILNLANTGEIELIGTTAEAWLGVPLIIGGKVSGVLVVQDYDNPQAYNQTHLELLEMVSTEMSICIERKQSEEALKQRESILSAIFDSTADGLLIIDNNGKVIHRNTKFNKMWRIPSKLINSTDDTELLDFVLNQLSEPNQFTEKVKELYKSSKSDYDVIYFKDGRIFERRSNPLLMGSTVNGRVWSFNDITERKQHEKELKIAKEKIVESEEKHRTVANYANDWEYWIDTNGNFVYISPSCKRITGYKPDDFLNNKELMQEIIYPDDVNIFQNHKHDIDENVERSQTEFRIITKQKKIRWIGHVCQNVIATNGKLLGVRGSNRDITDRKKAEQALMKSEAELKELNATKDKLYSIIAHDLRSPFNSILGFSDLLLDIANLRDIEKTLKYSTLINTTAKHTLTLLDNLLNWGKLQTGKINFKQENVGLQPIIQEILDTLNSTAILKNISLNQIQSDDIEVYADENMLKTILRNLISNAIKYTETGGNVNIFVIPVKNQIEISISDDGVGMKDETRKKLFDISTNITTKGTANEKGTGLGLVLCKEFVEKLGGNIWVESEEGKGSIFYFTLPNQNETIKENISKNEILPPVEVSPIKKLKILIVEDDEASEKLISITVRKFGKEIINVKTGKDAVEACLDNPDIDLVLMDIQLPGMDGYEATRQIRKFNKDVIIIAQTAYALKGDKEKAIAVGCNDYISKPINVDELKHKINKYLNKE